MNVETLCIFGIVAIAVVLFSLAHRRPIPEPVYRNEVRIRPDRSLQVSVALLACIWVAANFGSFARLAERMPDIGQRLIDDAAGIPAAAVAAIGWIFQ